MNFYNPYFGIPSFGVTPSVSRGLFSGALRRGINWGSILNNTQRTLGLINQAIPVVKQVSPIVNNAKTMFRVMNEFKKIDTPTESETVADNQNTTSSNQTETTINNRPTSSQGPTFFV